MLSIEIDFPELSDNIRWRRVVIDATGPYSHAKKGFHGF